MDGAEAFFTGTAGILFLALALDALVGDPPALWSRIPHPVVLFGNVIGWAERRWNTSGEANEARRQRGVALVVLLLIGAALAGWLTHRAFSFFPYGWLLEAAVASIFLAQRSLYDHVRAVVVGFSSDGLPGARRAVSMIVGRDPEQLEEAGVCRAAIETLAENFSDGVVAPAFWYLIAGLPGLFAYKALNTADSMIGHRSERYRDFGWAAARLDDFANLIPARLSAVLFWGAAVAMPDADPGAAIRATRRDAKHHRSPNAGWPEAATAGALGLRLAGPRTYAGETVEDSWMGDGRAEAAPADILRALSLFRFACLGLIFVVALFAMATL